MSNNIDYPSTGGWGQTDGQWKVGKSQYEVMEAQRNKKRDYCNRLEQIRDATRKFVAQIEVFASIMDNDLPKEELESLRRLWTLHSKKLNGMTIYLNDQRNILRKMDTDLYNFKQRR